MPVPVLAVLPTLVLWPLPDGVWLVEEEVPALGDEVAVQEG